MKYFPSHLSVCVPRGLVVMIHLACRRSWVQIGQNLFFFSLLFFSFPLVFFLVIIAVCLAISQAIFTQIKAKVQWNLSPRGGLSLWQEFFYKKCFSVHWNSTKWQNFWYFAWLWSREIQVNPRNPTKFRKTQKILWNSVEVLLRWFPSKRT